MPSIDERVTNVEGLEHLPGEIGQALAKEGPLEQGIVNHG
jgi:hypothetical protein